MGETKQQAGLGGFQPDFDVHISLEDQEKINHFARCNARHDDIQSELTAKQNELKNIEDAIEELVLYDEDSGKISFRQGEVFLCMNLNDTNNALEKVKETVSNEIKHLEKISGELKTVMGNLKVQLYAKFGDHINLEEED